MKPQRYTVGLAAALVAGLLFGAVRLAHRPGPSAWEITSSQTFIQTSFASYCPAGQPRMIEQQSDEHSHTGGVNSYTGRIGPVCATSAEDGYSWDTDDLPSQQEGGQLAQGESHAIAFPLIFDNGTRVLREVVHAGNGRTYTVTFSAPDGFTYTYSAAGDSQVCLYGVSNNLAALPEIAGTNGGRGARGLVTMLLTATDPRGLGHDVTMDFRAIYPAPNNAIGECGGTTLTRINDSWALLGP